MFSLFITYFYFIQWSTLTGLIFNCYFLTDAPPAKRPKVLQEESEKVPTEEVLGDLSGDIVTFWKPLGRKLKIPNANIEEIQADNVQYPSVKEKSFQMLMVWMDRGESVTFAELSKALKALGKNRLVQKYCSGL